MGVGLVHGSGPIAWEWDYCMGVGLLHGSGPSASSPIDVTSLLQAGGGPPDRQVAEGGFATLLSLSLESDGHSPFHWLCAEASGGPQDRQVSQGGVATLLS